MSYAQHQNGKPISVLNIERAIQRGNYNAQNLPPSTLRANAPAWLPPAWKPVQPMRLEVRNPTHWPKLGSKRKNRKTRKSTRKMRK